MFLSVNYLLDSYWNDGRYSAQTDMLDKEHEIIKSRSVAIYMVILAFILKNWVWSVINLS